ncbi:MAG: DUF2256 domain-containing protein [Verrucomicrobiota bacterium]|nr:DUF2256 domain-containing protein [Verrucomicrobiota bacterium]
MKFTIKSQIKICRKCGRSFSNRKKWQSRGIWNEVVYCSDKCRNGGKRSNESRLVD